MPSSTQASDSRSAWRLFSFAAAIILVTGLLLLPWWRNHTILQDFYDYGLVMAGAGRIELGERPYVDFLTPIQTLHFRLAVLAESIFGPHYLSLTYANAIFIAGGFLGMVALLFRPLGALTAIIVAAAVVAASSGQHTIVWHNALGVAWVAGVVWLAARLKFSRTTWWQIGLICSLLYLGGMTKLTYQVAALAFAGLFAVRDGWLGSRSWGKTGLTLTAYFLSGVIAPVATEIFYTGATFQQWYYNVVQLPGSRLEMLQQMESLSFFLKPIHDHYHPMLLPFVAAWALGLIVLVTLFAVRSVGAIKERKISAGLLLLVTAAGAWLCGGVMLATNIEIAYLAGALWLVLATGVALAWPGEKTVVGRWTRFTLGAAALVLLGTSWLSAWSGTRSLWAAWPLQRETLVSTDSLAKRYDYFRGMKITELTRLSMEGFDLRMHELTFRGIKPGQIYFVNATEWMVRAVPEARHRGLPLWLHQGTSYGEAESRVINHRLALQEEIRAVVSIEAWNKWTGQTDWYLEKLYSRDRYGPLFNVYIGKNEAFNVTANPILFAVETSSTANVRDFITTGAPLGLRVSPDGSFLGADASFGFKINIPVSRIQGKWVMRRIALGMNKSSPIIWRAVTADALGHRKILREEHLSLGARENEQSMVFDLEPGNQPVAFEVELPLGQKIEMGVRELRTDYTSVTPDAPPQIADASIPPQTPVPAWSNVLFTQPAWQEGTVVKASSLSVNADQMPTGPELMVHTPGEVWFRIDDPRIKQLKGEFGLRPVAWTEPYALEGVLARVVFYRPGHLEVLFEKKIRPKKIESDRAGQTFVVDLPGAAGWVGLTFISLNAPANAYGQSWWRRLELH